jgi:hypothetical protein
VTAPALHFAFIDGGMQYDCPSCDAHCCRGAGFAGSMDRELPKLLTLYPPLGHMATGRHGPVVYFANPPNGCYFLDADRLCRVEKEHGRALKPSICGLFPFNVFSRVGTAVVVRPHFLCPLQAVVPARPGAVYGTHADLAAQVHDSALLAPAFLDAHVAPAPLHPSADAAATLARELRFRDRSAEALGRERLVDLLRADAPDAAAFDADVRRAAALLALDPSELERPRDAVDDVLVLLAAPLRIGLLRRSHAGTLCALAIGALLVRRQLALASPATPTLSGGWDLHFKMVNALRLIARLDEPMDANAAVPAFDDPALALAASIALRASPSSGTLSSLERAILPSMSLADRMVLVNALGTAVERAVEAETRLRPTSWRAGDGGSSPAGD